NIGLIKRAIGSYQEVLFGTLTTTIPRYSWLLADWLAEERH
ncbi:hypothetical protein Gohar_009098, partial [Gossypium harknessii]|nr:hypothetical protein [Gossypium harknessii]